MKTLSFSVLAVIVVVLAASTWAEHCYGAVFTGEHLYGSYWFIALWAILALSSLCYILRRKLQRNVPAFLLHLSFLVILSGALLTALTARRGTVHLRIDEPVTGFVTDSQEDSSLPFTLTLNTFAIDYYPGTDAPADYVSRFTVRTSDGNVFQDQVSMNQIFIYRGIRFYQASYDSDGLGSLLTVNDDRWGVPVTYAGYFLLFISMIWNLFSRKGTFRRMLRHPLLRRAGVLAAFLLVCHWANAAGRTLSRPDAASLGEMQVLYNGRIAPLQTLASDFTLKLTGKRGYRSYTPEQVLLGWLLFPASWQETPMIRVKDAALRKALAMTGEDISWKAFYSPQNEYLLEPYLNAPAGPVKKAAAEADEKIQLLRMLHEGELFKVFPVSLDGRTVWYAATSDLPVELDDGRWLFIRKSLSLLSESVLRGDGKQIRYLTSKLIAYQQKNGGESLLPAWKVKAEIIYNRIPFTSLLYKVNLGLGLLLSGYLCLCLVRRKKMAGTAVHLFTVFLCVSFLFLTFALVLRGFVSGRLPISNGFETMSALAWFVMLITILFGRRFRFLLPLGFLLSGFTLLVASLGQMNPQITPLMPVLASPLLSLHVSLIMMSYALFSFTFLNGILALILSARKEVTSVKMLQVFSRLLLTPALFLLGAGIFIGAIWANVSWGRYWAWDPKEVWALITFLVYAFALHSDSLPRLGKPLFFHLYLTVSFLTIPMTYFGVNYFLGGMHSYA